MKNLMIMCLLAGLFAMCGAVLYACGSHETNTADAIADVLGKVDDANTSVDITTKTYDGWTDRTGQKGQETTIKKGKEIVRVFPSGDHRITAEYTDANGNKTTQTYSTEYDIPSIGKFIQDHFPVGKDVEEQEYSG
jgi:hypothetical protein